MTKKVNRLVLSATAHNDGAIHLTCASAIIVVVLFHGRIASDFPLRLLNFALWLLKYAVAASSRIIAAAVVHSFALSVLRN